jgi:PEP-CTERM motif
MVCDMKLQRCFWPVVCALTVLCSAQLANAAPIVGSMSESFSSYPDATTFANVTLPTTTQNGGLGFNATGTTAANDPNSAWGGVLNAGANRTVNAPGLTFNATGYLAASGNKLTIDAATANATNNIGRNLGQTIDAGTTFFSFLLARNTADTIRTFNLAFENGTSEQLTVGQIGATAGNSNGAIALLMNNSNPAGLFTAANPVALGNSVTHLVIGRTNEVVTLWVDPTNVTSQAAAGAAYITNSTFNVTGISAIRPFAGNTATITGLNGNAVSGSFDEIRLGGTWAAVTSAAVVPEPATIVLAGLGFAGLFGLARRGRKAI